MKNLNFRTLNKNEIECRIGMVKPNGFTLLLYKDARCDMRILDETVGAMNWQRSHSRENANCIVSIWDDDKSMWISKEDTGTENKNEPEKSLASDSFKRSCVCWGIGRELYSAPFIWISGKAADYQSNRFSVDEIGYDDQRNISHLTISYDGKTIYTYGKTKPMNAQTDPERQYDERNARIKSFCTAHNIDSSGFLIAKKALVTAGVVVPKTIQQMTDAQFDECMTLLEREFNK